MVIALKVGILELLSLPAHNIPVAAYHTLVTKQFASIMPQVISVWCRQLGHQSFYATYYGVGNPQKLLPSDLDIVFISCCTEMSALAYALAKLYRKAGVKTVMGGPHTKSFPADALRFFDLVIKECDKSLIADILADHFEPGMFISSTKPLDDLPSVEEREPEIRASAFFGGRWRNPLLWSVVPNMSSMGCPYSCDFCADWDTPYRVLPMERLEADLKFIAQKLPGTAVAFWEPNFAVKFEQIFELLESIPMDSRIPYMMECSLSLLNESRIQRLKETGCISALFGIESWTDYANKSGLGGKRSAEDKLSKVIKKFRQLKDNIKHMQATFIFGIDTDSGNQPVELTKAFMREIPYVWPTLNTPSPYGGTPLQARLLEEGRILETLPFMFYVTPNLAITLKNYDPRDYFEKLIELSNFIASDSLLKQRLQTTSTSKGRFLHRVRTLGEKYLTQQYSQTLELLRTDKNFLAFHEGRSTLLPDFYQHQFEKKLGRYASLLSSKERTPNLEQRTPLLI